MFLIILIGIIYLIIGCISLFTALMFFELGRPKDLVQSGLIILLGTFLLIRYKGKLSPIEKQQKMNEQRHYILGKIKQFQDIKQQRRQELITGLPKWESDFKIMNEKFYK